MNTTLVIKVLAMCMLLPWSLIAYIAWVFWYKPKYLHKPRAYKRLDLNNVKSVNPYVNKLLSR